MDRLTVILYLSICNVVWFSDYNLGIFKILLMVLIILYNKKVFLNKRSYQMMPPFIFLIMTILLSFYMQPPAPHFKKINFLYGFVECYIMYTLGDYYSKCNYINYVFFRRLLYIILPLCVLIISNFLIDLPDWHSPSTIIALNSQMERGYYGGHLEPLYSTGFGIARTGWSNSLCQFLPIALLLRDSWFKRLALFLLSFCVIISSSRGGLLCLATIYTLYFMYITKERKIKIKFLRVAVVVFLLAYFNFGGFSSFLRLAGNEDFSTGRLDQYALLPKILSDFNAWGLGADSMTSLYNELGGNFTLHNSYLRLPLELGIPFLVPFFLLLVFIVFIFIHSFFGKKNPLFFPNTKILALITLSGLITSFFEPQGVFGAINWYCIWWFVLGVLHNLYVTRKGRNI